MSLVVVGSVAYDGIETPHGKVDRILGGAATYIALSASYFTPVRIVAVVGEDFAQEDYDLLAGHHVDLAGLERADGATFRWKGRYDYDLNEAHTLDTQLNVFETFAPKIPEAFKDSDFVFLANIQPGLQLQVAEQVSSPRVIAFAVSVTLTAALYLFLKRTQLGKSIRAVAQEREGALTVGINLRRIYALAFGIGCACVGAAGSLVVPFYAVDPYVGGVFVITAFVVVVLGGMGNFAGALVASLIVGVAESLAAVFIPAAMKQIVMYSIFVVVLLFRPQGLFGARRT